MPEHIENAARAFVKHCARTPRCRYHTDHLSPFSPDMCFDEQCGVLIAIKGDLQLTKSQKVVFCTLLEARDRPVSAETLALRLASDHGEAPVIKTVHNTISLLRTRLAQLSSAVRIETRYGYGYCLRISSLAPQID
jgi:DNA-binding response OmpR family regulator